MNTQDFDFSQFYKFSDPMEDRRLRLEVGADKAADIDPWALARGELKPAQPLRLKGFMGHKLSSRTKQMNNRIKGPLRV